MGYFDALTASYFKTAPDGRRLFYPWGIWGRGYVVASQQNYGRLRGQIKIYTIASLVLIIPVATLLHYLWAMAVTLLVIVFYLCWVPFLLRGLQPTDERMSLSESMSGQARLQNASTLWMLLIVSILFVLTGFAMLVFDPDKWLVGGFAIVFFGLCAAVAVRMLILRRRAFTQQA